jgi:hypothetical protein
MTNDLIASFNNGPAIAADGLNGDRDVSAADPFDLPTTWESAWIDIGGEG